MTLTLSQSAYWEIIYESKENQLSTLSIDEFDVTFQYPVKLGNGYSRCIDLQPGLDLDIANYQLYDEMITKSVDREHPIEYTFDLVGVNAGGYGFYGSGLAPGGILEHSLAQPITWLSVHVEPELFCQWFGNMGKLPKNLQPLIRKSDQKYYERYGKTTSAMQMVLQQIDRGFLAFGNGMLDIPVERILGEPDDVSKIEEIGLSYRLEHNFNDNWKVRNAFRYQSSDTFDYRAEPVRLDETTGILTRNLRSNDDYQESYTLQTDVVGKFTTGSINHTLLFGVDLARFTSGGTQSRLPGGITPSIDVFNPVYNVIPRPGLDELTNVVRNNQNRSTGLGIFLQNQIAFADNLKLLVGGRFDTVDQNSKDLRDGSESGRYDSAFTPRLGIVYQPIEPISLYASYSKSFQPNFGTRADGSILEAERGTQYEVGVKGEFLDGRLAATLAAYRITKTNIATTDLANPDFLNSIGEQRSQGIELNVAGEISPGWNVIASYAYLDAEITQDNDGLQGNRPGNFPFNTASLWTTYELQRGSLQGLGFGFGLFYVGDRQGDFENTYVIPGYLRTDAAIYYKRDNWRAGINIQNLFNEKYFQGANFGRVAIEPGAPLTVIGSFSVTF